MALVIEKKDWLFQVVRACVLIRPDIVSLVLYYDQVLNSMKAPNR